MEMFQDHLQDELKNDEFKTVYEEEKELLDLSLKVLEARKEQGLTQKELAEKSHITQQQLSKIENGVNCNIITFLKVCYALGLRLNLEKSDFSFVH